ncbi:RNase H family protein [Siminovitchia sp. FSL H7-0308]|uniref:Ribonuclease HI n=1 Tax=Siminovitchia thermophila TaxID=1245522 RepID=A0ABS2R9V4_9BACI|nr:RNase H family protein [Siminovitchia thermophila]MBM7716421.1 ribonuclease HI [Siminovitchia thermophila]
MIEIYIDGASAGDPGPSGAGIFINNDGKVKQYALPLGIASNHEAEFLALIKALELCSGEEDAIISVRSDSTLVVDAIEKQFVKNKKYTHLLDQALRLTEQFNLFFIKWVPSKENKKADELAKKAIRLN